MIAIPGIYILTSPSGKKYVGQAKNIEVRWRRYLKCKGAGPHLLAAFKKYGPESFDYQILCEVMTYDKKELDRLEKLWIARLNTNDPQYGYNMTVGGDGGDTWTGRTHSQESRQKISDALRLHERTDEHKAALKEAVQNAHRGVPQTRESNEKRSKTLAGRKRPAEVVEKIRAKLKGRPTNHEVCEKNRETQQAWWSQDNDEVKSAKERLSQAAKSAWDDPIKGPILRARLIERNKARRRSGL